MFKKCCSIQLLTRFRQGFIWTILSTKQLLNQASSWGWHVTPVLLKTSRAAGQHSGSPASRWWMWKIPVRGLNAVSLKPDFYTSKGTQKVEEGKTGYSAHAQPSFSLSRVLCPVSSNQICFLTEVAALLIPSSACQLYFWVVALSGSRCVFLRMCITLWTRECHHALLPASLGGSFLPTSDCFLSN